MEAETSCDTEGAAPSPQLPGVGPYQVAFVNRLRGEGKYASDGRTSRRLV